MTGRKRSAKEKYRIVMEGIASGNRAETCRRHGISSQQYYQWRKRVEDSAMEGLKRKPGKQKKDNTKEMEQELDRMRRVIAEITSENVFLKKYLGLDSRKRFSLPMKRYLLREIERVRKRSGLSTREALHRYDFSPSRYYRWCRKAAMNQLVDDIHTPDSLLSPLPEEEKAVIEYALSHPSEGYRRLTYMMIDDDVVYLSPSTVYRILKKHDLLYLWKRTKGSKTPLYEPFLPHQ